nr:MAG: hypothetical protein [Aspergillus flavus polymycovirus 1]
MDCTNQFSIIRGGIPPGIPDVDESLVDFVSWLTICGFPPDEILKILRGANNGKVPSVFLMHMGKPAARLAVHSIIFDEGQWDGLYGIPAHDIKLMQRMFSVSPEQVTEILCYMLNIALVDLDVTAVADDNSFVAGAEYDLTNMSSKLGHEFATLGQLFAAKITDFGHNDFHCDLVVMGDAEHKAVLLGGGFFTAHASETPALAAANLAMGSDFDAPAVQMLLYWVDDGGTVYPAHTKEFQEAARGRLDDVGWQSKDITRERLARGAKFKRLNPLFDKWEGLLDECGVPYG